MISEAVTTILTTTAINTLTAKRGCRTDNFAFFRICESTRCVARVSLPRMMYRAQVVFGAAVSLI